MTRAHPLHTGHASQTEREETSADTSSELRLKNILVYIRSQRFRSRPETSISLANTITRPTLSTRMPFVATRVRGETLYPELNYYYSLIRAAVRDVAYISRKYFAICSSDVNADSSSSVCVCLCVSTEIETKRDRKKKIIADFYQSENQRTNTDSDFSVECCF